MSIRNETTSNLRQIFAEMETRFTSGNDIPVERATIKKEEFDAIRNFLLPHIAEIERGQKALAELRAYLTPPHTPNE